MGRYFLPIDSRWRPYLQLMPWIEHRRIWGVRQPQQRVERFDDSENLPFVRLAGGTMIPLSPILNLDLSLGWQTPLSTLPLR